MWSVRCFLCMQVRMETIAAMQRAYHHARFAGRSYRQLAAENANDVSYDRLLKLADLADKRAQRYRTRMRSFKVELPSEKDTWEDKAWRRLLAHCSLRWMLSWLDRVRQTDLERIDELLLVRRFWEL